MPSASAAWLLLPALEIRYRLPLDPHDDQGASGGLVTIDEGHEVLGVVFVPENRGQASKARAHCPERADGRKAGGAAAAGRAHFLLEEAPADPAAAT